MYCTREDGNVFFIGFCILVVSLLIVQVIKKFEGFQDTDVILEQLILFQRTIENIKSTSVTTINNRELAKTIKDLTKRVDAYMNWWQGLTVEQKLIHKELVYTPKFQKLLNDINQTIQTYNLQVSPIPKPIV